MDYAYMNYAEEPHLRSSSGFVETPPSSHQRNGFVERWHHGFVCPSAIHPL